MDVKRSSGFSAALAGFSIFGFMFGFWQVLLPDLQVALQLSEGALGAAITIGFLGSLPTMFFGGRLADRAGVSRLIFLTGLGLALGLIGISNSSHFWILVISLLLFFGSSGAFDVGINTAAIGVERASGKKVLPYMHAGFSGFAALGALTVAAFVQFGLPFRAAYVIAACGIVCFVLLIGIYRPFPKSIQQQGIRIRGTLFFDIGILGIAAIVALAFLGEGTLETWSAIFLRERLHVATAQGAIAVASFHGAMMIGRLLAGTVLRVLSRRQVLVIAGVISAAAMIMALTANYYNVIVGGFVCVGLALSVVAPIGFSLVGDQDSSRTAEASSVVTIVGYLSFLVGPAMIGGLAEAFGLRAALGSVIISGLAISLFAAKIAIAPVGRPSAADITIPRENGSDH
jgi:MFS family permease